MGMAQATALMPSETLRVAAMVAASTFMSRANFSRAPATFTS